MIFARARRGGLILALILLTLTPVGCDQVQQQLTGAKDQGPVLRALRDTLAARRNRLSNAVLYNQDDFIPRYINELGTTLDSLETQAGKMSIMDGQDMRLKVASARNTIQAAQPFIMQNDVDGIKAQQKIIDQVLFEIDGILERAISMTDTPPPGGGS